MAHHYAAADEGFAESVRCLSCGERYLKPSRGSITATNPGCPRCGYVGWVPISGGAEQPRFGAGRQLRPLR